MKYNLHSFLIIALIGCATSFAAQESRLNGKVLPRDNPAQRGWGQIKVKVKNRATNQEYEGEQKCTDDHTWFHGAPLGASVDVLFDKSCYLPDGLYDILVRPNNPELETVRLEKTRECQMADRQQRGRQVIKSATRPAPAARTSDTIPKTSQSGKLALSASETSRGEPEQDDDLLPSTRTLKKELATAAARARRGEFFDTFQYNFAVKMEMYRGRGALIGILSQFRLDPKNKDLFKQVGSVTPETFIDTVRGQFETSGEVNLDNIKRVIKDEALSPSVRGSATVAILNRDLDKNTADEMRSYYRKQAQNPGSGVFASSLVALARIGDESDKGKLYDDIRNSKDERRVIASMQAVAATQIIEGSEALPGGSSTLAEVAANAENPEVRAAAFYALRPFAHQMDQTAINALMKGAREDENELVRKRATQVLGFGDLEEVPGVRKTLRAVAKADPSRFVRQAAKVSLSGAKWFVTY